METSLLAGGISRQRSAKRTAYLTLMAAILLLVFAFYANGLSTDAFWTDEMFSVGNMGGFDPPRAPADIIRSVADNFPDHVPLFFLMGAGWAHVVGWTQFALRTFPILAGILLIAWMYRLGTDLFGKSTGVIAALLLGTSAYAIMYVHDFRMYSLLLMLAAMHLWLYFRINTKRNPGRLTWLLFLVTNVALLYTHLFALIFLASLGLYHILLSAKSARWLKVLLSWAVGALLFAPYISILIAGIQRAARLENVTSSAATAIELLPTFLWLLMNGSWVLALFIAGMLMTILRQKHNAFVLKLTSMTVTMLVLILLGNALIGLIPLDRMRYFIILWIPCILLIAYSLTQIPRLNGITFFVLLLWIVSGYQFYRSTEIRYHIGGMSKVFLYPPMQDWAYFLKGKIRSQDYLVGFSDSDHVNQDMDLGQSTADYYTHVYLGIDGAFIQRRGWGEWLARNIERNLSNHPRLIFLYDPENLPPTFDRVFDRIIENHISCDIVLNYEGLLAQRYVHPLAGCEREYQPINYDNGIKIVDHFGAYDPENERVQIVTGWEVVDERQLDEYNISFQILTGDWQKMSQLDEHLYNDILKWHELEMSTAQLPPGNYRLVVILYDRYTGEKVPGIDQTSGEYGSILPLLTFTVES